MIRMLNTVKTIAFVTFKEWMAYRSHVLVSLFVGPAVFITQYCICQAIFSSGSTINGYTLAGMLTYYGVATCLSYLIYDSAGWNIQMLVGTGLFLTYMLRPVNHRLFAFSQKVGHRILGFALEFIPIYLIFFLVFKIALFPAQPGWFLLSVVLSFVLSFLLNYTTGVLAFWFTRTEGIRRIYLLLQDILSGVFLPLNFFPGPFQLALVFLPFQYVTYVPIRVFLGSYSLAGFDLDIPVIVGLQAAMTLAVFLLSGLVYRLGLKRFTGAGA
jgi:ABC-2 type transport system permease protein